MMRSRSQLLAWRRGWIAPDSELPLLMESWLPEPEMLDGTGVVTLEEVRNVPCLMLLGEPGSGKSHVLRQEGEEIRQHAAGEAVVSVTWGFPRTPVSYASSCSTMR
jgi:hypothetical protein